MTPAREIILAMLEKYRAAGIDEIRDPRGFRPSPFFEMGQAPGVTKRFGSLPKLQKSLPIAKADLHLVYFALR